MDVNYGGVVNVLKAVLPSMVEARRGAVVVTGSMGEWRRGKRKRERKKKEGKKKEKPSRDF